VVWQRILITSSSIEKPATSSTTIFQRVVQEYMDEIGKITGRPHKMFDYYGAKDADRVIIAMGSVTEATARLSII
jgi:pyruvate/2-oxoacid:ferredoxin oxidoreductase alpha subunit